MCGMSLIVAIGAQNLYVLRQGVLRRYVSLVVGICAASDVALISLGVGLGGAVIGGRAWLLGAVRFAGAAFAFGYAAFAARRSWRPVGKSLNGWGSASIRGSGCGGLPGLHMAQPFRLHGHGRASRDGSEHKPGAPMVVRRRRGRCELRLVRAAWFRCAVADARVCPTSCLAAARRLHGRRDGTGRVPPARSLGAEPLQPAHCRSSGTLPVSCAVAISPYIRDIRKSIGTSLLLLPSVAVLPFGEDGRLLLVQNADTGQWQTIGGSIEPDESPRDAGVREALEEAGVTVELVRLLDVIGGAEFRITYPNGDQTAYVSVVFEAVVRSGTPTPDGQETSAVRWWRHDELPHAPLSNFTRSLFATSSFWRPGSRGRNSRTSALAQVPSSAWAGFGHSVKLGEDGPGEPLLVLQH